MLIDMEEKKKRGCNYTVAEKDILLELVKKYQNIIENKETNASMILKKREAWDSVCQQYNAVAASGFRTWQQLRHLYENLKQRSKKNIAKVNRLQFYEKTNDVKDVKIKASVDKKEINRTGGGSYRSTLTEHDAQILAMVAPQIQPLSNPYDDAALYFGDTDSNNNNETEVEVSSDIILNNTVNIDKQVIIMSDENCEPCTVTSKSADNQEVSITTTSTTIYENHKPSTSASKTTEQGKPKYKQSNIKEQYFKAKLRNAKLENKYLINKNKMEINKYKIEMQILQLRLKKLQYSKKN